MRGISIGTREAVEVAERAAGILPEAGRTVVLDHLVSGMTPEALEALSPQAQEKLLHQLRGTEAAPSATTSLAVSEEREINGYKAVVGQITVNGKRLDTPLSKGSFCCKSPEDQEQYAGTFGGKRPYRMVTHEENRAYVEGLLEKEKNKTINKAEEYALQTYRDQYMLDTASGLTVVGGRPDDCFSWGCHGRPGALFVRDSAESK